MEQKKKRGVHVFEDGSVIHTPTQSCADAVSKIEEGMNSCPSKKSTKSIEDALCP